MKPGPGCWSEAELRALADSCDTLLREDHDDLDRMAVPLLHFRSAHPDTLAAAYAGLQMENSGIGVKFRDRLARLRDRWFETISNGFRGDKIPESADVLLVSHYQSPKQSANSQTDPYFGTLASDLSAAGYRTVTALLDHTGGRADVANWASGSTPRVLLRHRLGRKSEMEFCERGDAAAARLLQGGDHTSLRRLAAAQARRGAARDAMRIGRQVEALVSKLKPAALVFTYEGHAWERLAMASARASSPKIKCLAVHHAILAPLQFAMLRRYGERYDPDVIFAAGEIALEWFRSQDSLKDIPIELLGSPRSVSVGDVEPPVNKDSLCLFLPEGMMSETIALSRVALSVARNMPTVTCRVRLHPLQTVERVCRADTDLRNAPANFEWSTSDRDLLSDCNEARWVAYRGSSAVLTALNAAAIPIYVGQETKTLRIDPLRRKSGFGHVARDADSLCGLLTSLYEEDGDALAAGKAYAASYYTPFSPKALASHLPLPDRSDMVTKA